MIKILVPPKANLVPTPRAANAKYGSVAIVAK
jgi:hypothetical protein